jgi:C-terminal processing protease CtpA/Prc
MRDETLRSESTTTPLPPEQAELRLTAVVAFAAGAAAAVLPVLVALTRGWDYRLAAMLGACVAFGCFVLGRKTLSAADAAGRLSFEIAAAHAAMLFCVHASDWLDWRPLGIDDALAGLAVGLVLLVLGPTRRALCLAASVPAHASAALVVLAVAPAAVAYLDLLLVQRELDLARANAAGRVAGLAASLVLAWLGTAFAVRRGLHGTGLVLSMLSGLVVVLLLDEWGLPLARAAAWAVLACAVLGFVVACAWCRSAFRRSERHDGLLAGLVIASVVAVAVGAWPIAGLTGAGALGAWWWFYRRAGLPLLTLGAQSRIDWRQSGFAGAINAFAVVYYLMQGFLIPAAAANLTGPMVLAALGDLGLYRVSEFTFARALLADQYLWRDEPSRVRPIAAASPDRLIRVLRHERDGWSGARDVAAWRAAEDRKPKGIGLVFGPEGTDGWTVSHVYPGSPAEAAGVRRGDVVRAIDGIPVDGLGWARPAGERHPSGATRLELASPGGAPREVTIERAVYARPVVIVQKTLDEAGRRVGYVVLDHFLGAAGEEFVNAAVRLQEEGIDDLVLDLRTNPGGNLSVARDIASVIGGRRLDRRTFLRLVHNERHRDRDEDIAFQAPKAVALSLSRVIVITSPEACSASEALINGLRPYMTVITVGATTCGKPVGMTVVEYRERAYSVITFRALNARGEGDYFTGLHPTCAAADDHTRELGDPAEASLKAALHYIRDGRCPDAADGTTDEV